ncbi:hypothetical protein [Virgisporangium ochraceum]|uniref:Uncharacterized protein n=1 Tax=Virgisporangium ochraceum TaxID=65505 RepID=A0A8J3ZSN6_9ACTN|nr:hypothetical protein [Virgisporangium ochraceum]GIJ68986.1 hypothetical protein Voc01_039030 [Virgisporangium ochraceum]
MRPTSESDRDARTDPSDPSDDTVRNDPWATGPGHLTHDDQTERFVPEQRDPQDHDGHLYASDTYAEPETTVLPADGAHNADGTHGDQAAVGVAHVDTDSHTGTDTDKADDAAAKADHAKQEAEEAKAEAEEARHDGTHTADGDTHAFDSGTHDSAFDDGGHTEGRHEVSADELESTREEPAVVVEPVPEPVPVAVVEPVDDGRHDEPGHFAAVPVTATDTTPVHTTDADATTADDSTGELKPGDVPVAPVAGFFAADAAQGLRDRWREAQLGFVDDPRKAVDDVKSLVGEAVDQFTAAVSAQRDELDAAAGEDTEQYRVAVQRYRAFFDRLLGL